MVGLITPEDVLYIGNAGDCRAVLCSAGEAIALSMDHKPTLPTETARIKRAGGVVEDDRVEGDLAVSRALGDFEYKSVCFRCWGQQGSALTIASTASRSPAQRTNGFSRTRRC